MELISRVASGWNVRMMLSGKRLGRFFADAGLGGKAAALKAAKAYRDELLAGRPLRIRSTKPLLVMRAGSPCYQIRIPKRDGGTTTTEFSVTRHGPRKARQMATDALQAAEARLVAKA